MTLKRSAHGAPVSTEDLASATQLPRVLRPQRAVPSDAVRPTRAEVNLANLRHNLHVMRRAAFGAEVWCVLKADGYGHGAKAVARTLERAGANGVCVALLEEGVELREAGIRLPILVMGGHYGNAWGELLRHELTPVVFEAAQIEALAEEARFSGAAPVGVHLKIDTGMARLGVAPSDVPSVAACLARHPEVVLDGLMTHFACADSGDKASLEHQLSVFASAEAALKRHGLVPRLRHAANSAATLYSPHTRLDMIRTGIALFGVEPCEGTCPELRPVMKVSTEVVALRELAVGMPVGYGATFHAARPTRIATIPMGYADGLSRGLSNRGHVLVRGRRAPIVGTVSMDMTMLDVTDIPEVALGDDCVVLGAQKGPLGEDELGAHELARALGTIPWEILTSISRRVPRFYREP
jgi:alanine racemase